MPKPNLSFLNRLVPLAQSHDIHWAVERLQTGKAVRRATWGLSSYITPCDSCHGFRLHIRGSVGTPHWTPYASDLIATDWEEAETR